MYLQFQFLGHHKTNVSFDLMIFLTEIRFQYSLLNSIFCNSCIGCLKSVGDPQVFQILKWRHLRITIDITEVDQELSHRVCFVLNASLCHLKRQKTKMVTKFHPVRGQVHMSRDLIMNSDSSKFYFRIKGANQLENFSINTRFDQFIPQRRT